VTNTDRVYARLTTEIIELDVKINEGDIRIHQMIGEIKSSCASLRRFGTPLARGISRALSFSDEAGNSLFVKESGRKILIGNFPHCKKVDTVLILSGISKEDLQRALSADPLVPFTITLKFEHQINNL